jgi:hypothetical protein
MDWDYLYNLLPFPPLDIPEWVNGLSNNILTLQFTLTSLQDHVGTHHVLGILVTMVLNITSDRKLFILACDIVSIIVRVIDIAIRLATRYCSLLFVPL